MSLKIYFSLRPITKSNSWLSSRNPSADRCWSARRATGFRIFLYWYLSACCSQRQEERGWAKVWAAHRNNVIKLFRAERSCRVIGLITANDPRHSLCDLKHCHRNIDEGHLKASVVFTSFPVRWEMNSSNSTRRPLQWTLTLPMLHPHCWVIMGFKCRLILTVMDYTASKSFKRLLIDFDIVPKWNRWLPGTEGKALQFPKARQHHFQNGPQ